MKRLDVSRATLMSRRVNLLLLLSALLSALTGVGASARSAQVPQAVSAQARADQTVPRRAVVSRPLAALPTVAANAAAPIVRAPTLRSAVPLYAGRRRE